MKNEIAKAQDAYPKIKIINFSKNQIDYDGLEKLKGGSGPTIDPNGLERGPSIEPT